MSLDKKKEGTAAVIKKVSRRQDDGGHSGAWKVAFADFVLALMCLFLVMWLLASREQETMAQLLRNGGGSPLAEGTQSRIEHQGTPHGSLIPRELVPGQQATESRPNSQVKSSAQPSALDDGNGAKLRQRYDSAADLQKLAKMMSDLSVEAGLAGNIQTVITPYGLRVMLHDTDKQGMFERGSAVINERFKHLLQKMGQMFAHIDNQLLLVGHTDSLQYKGQDYAAFSNWSLSSNRAMAARMQLLLGGMASNGILQVVGMADRAPLDARHPDAALNRRIELLVLTTGQAQTVAAMFGMPGEGGQPAAGAEKPSAVELAALKQQLRP